MRRPPLSRLRRRFTLRGAPRHPSGALHAPRAARATFLGNTHEKEAAFLDAAPKIGSAADLEELPPHLLKEANTLPQYFMGRGPMHPLTASELQTFV